MRAIDSIPTEDSPPIQDYAIFLDGIFFGFFQNYGSFANAAVDALLHYEEEHHCAIRQHQKHIKLVDVYEKRDKIGRRYLEPYLSGELLMAKE
jgi:hypothetical protein